MSSKISFTYNDRDYCLEYTKDSVKKMEGRGFAPARVLEAPMTYLPELFAGAFLANHPYTNRKIIDEIFEKMKGKKALVNTLVQMYNEPIDGLMGDDEENEGNAIEWTKG